MNFFPKSGIYGIGYTFLERNEEQAKRFRSSDIQ